MPRGRPGSGAAKPWSKKKAAAMLSPDEQWAADLEAKILADCHPEQLEAVIDPSRRIALCTSRGSGKTATMRGRALIKLVKRRDARVVYIATSRPQAEQLNWSPLKTACSALELEVGKDIVFNESKMTLTCLRTGGTYRFVGADDRGEVDKLRGQPFDEVQLDEAASHNIALVSELLFRVVGPRLGERRGVLLLGGTPGHRLEGDFYDATHPKSAKQRPYRERPEGWMGWSSHTWTSMSVANLPEAKDPEQRKYAAIVANWEEALVEKAANLWSDDNPIWLREYMAQWATDFSTSVFRYQATKDGSPYNQWAPHGENHVEGIVGMQAAVAALRAERNDWHFVVTMDMGSKDPFACNVFAFSPSDQAKRIWHVFSFEQRDMYHEQIAKLLTGPALDTNKPGGILGITGWPDAMEIDADNATVDELTRHYGLRCTKAEKKADYKWGAIEMVNGDLIDGRIKVLKGTPLETQLATLQWATDEFGAVKENKAQANHSTDTLIYARRLIARLFESGAVAQEAAPTNPFADPMGLDPPRERSDRDDGDALQGWYDGDDGWGNG